MRPIRILVVCAALLGAAAITATALRPPGGAAGTREPVNPAPAFAAAPAASAAETAPAAPEAVAAAVPVAAAQRPAVAGRERGPAPAPAAGMVVAIDPETGALGLPTAEQMRELSAGGAGFERTGTGFETVQGPDGAVGVRVGTQFHEYSFAQIAPDGRVVRGCFIPGPHAHAAAELPVPAPRYEER